MATRRASICAFCVILNTFLTIRCEGVTFDSSKVAMVSAGVNISMLEKFSETSWTFVQDTPLPSKEILETVDAVFMSSIDKLVDVPSARLYQYLYTGYNDADLPKIPSHFTVCNCHQSEVAIAEYVLSTMLNFEINVPKMDAAFRSCTWKSDSPGNTCGNSGVHGELNNKTVGIIGYGHIGEGVATRAAAFGMTVIATTLNPPSVPPPPLKWLKSDAANGELMQEADYVVLACPLTNDTLGLVNKTLLGMMKPTGVLINIARGPVVEEESLYEALKSKAIGGAVLDVWWHPFAWDIPGGVGPASWPSQYRFDELDNVVITPHSSSHTVQSQMEAYHEGAANLDALALGKPLQNIVRNASMAEDSN